MKNRCFYKEVSQVRMSGLRHFPGTACVPVGSNLVRVSGCLLTSVSNKPHFVPSTL